MIIELVIIQQDMVGAGWGHHNDRRHILGKYGGTRWVSASIVRWAE